MLMILQEFPFFDMSVGVRHNIVVLLTYHDHAKPLINLKNQTMIPAFIIWLVNKYLLHSKKDNNQQSMLKPINRKKIIKLLSLILLFSIPSKAQQYHYNVLYKGNNIGNMYLAQIQTGDELSIKLTSNIQMNVLMSVSMYVAEESLYKEDKLIYSTVDRKVNGKQKANRQTKYCNGSYEIFTEGKKGKLNKTGINYNLARLYCKEPVNITEVYSDAFQQFLNIEVLGAHKYKLALPDGNYNVYYFKNGICNKVE